MKCSSKKIFPDYDSALSHCSNMFIKGKGIMYPYVCVHCKNIHVGHPSTPTPAELSKTYLKLRETVLEYYIELSGLRNTRDALRREIIDANAELIGIKKVINKQSLKSQKPILATNETIKKAKRNEHWLARWEDDGGMIPNLVGTADRERDNN